MEPIPAEIVEDTWKKIGGMSPLQSPALMKEMKRKQPQVMGYLLTIDDDILNRDERELLHYLGVVIWKMMEQGSAPPHRVKTKDLKNALNKNMEMLEYLQGERNQNFVATVQTIFDGYNQMEVLRYVIEALMEEPADGCNIRDENIGIMMLDLKTVIDCFDK